MRGRVDKRLYQRAAMDHARSIRMKLRMIVFITYSILLILKSTQKEYSLNKMADIHSFQDIQRNLVQRNCLNLFRTEKLT